MDLSKWEDKFNICLALEFSTPEYFRVHHILVPTYHLQCGKYTSEIQPSVVNLLRDFLLHPDVQPSRSQIEEISRRFSSNKRNEKIFTEIGTQIISSAMSILDIRTDTPQQYCQDVLAWAHSVLKEFESNNKKDLQIIL